MKVYDRSVAVQVVAEDCGGKLRDVVAGIALAGDVEGARLVLGEPLKPVDEEEVGVVGGPRVPALLVVG